MYQLLVTGLGTLLLVFLSGLRWVAPITRRVMIPAMSSYYVPRAFKQIRSHLQEV